MDTAIKKKVKIKVASIDTTDLVSPAAAPTPAPTAGTSSNRQPDDLSLRMIRLTGADKIEMFKYDLEHLVARYVKKIPEDAMAVRTLLEYISRSADPYVFFFVALDRNYTCVGYVLAHITPSKVMYIRQAIIDPRYGASAKTCWDVVEKVSRDYGCHDMELGTWIEEKVYTRFIKKYGFKRQMTYYTKTLGD